MNASPQRRKILLLCAVGGVLLLGLLVVSLVAPATPPPESSPTLRPSVVDQEQLPTDVGTSAFSLGAGDLASLAWRLGLVIIIIALSVLGLRWWGRKSSGPRSPGGFMRVVDTLPIGSGRTIHLVSIGQRVIAIGATSQSVAFLTDLSEAESASVMDKTRPHTDQSLGAFAAELYQSMRRGHVPGAQPGSEMKSGETESPFV